MGPIGCAPWALLHPHVTHFDESHVTHEALSNEVHGGHGARWHFPMSPMGRMGPMGWVALEPMMTSAATAWAWGAVWWSMGPMRPIVRAAPHRTYLDESHVADGAHSNEVHGHGARWLFPMSPMGRMGRHTASNAPDLVRPHDDKRSDCMGLRGSAVAHGTHGPRRVSPIGPDRTPCDPFG
jgi:hypothetical protein